MENLQRYGLSYVEAIIDIFPGGNLVDYRFPKDKLKTKEFDRAVSELYDGHDDAAAFNSIVSAAIITDNNFH